MRQLARFALELAVEYDTGSPHDRRRVGVCQALVDFYGILESEKQLLTEAAKTALPRIGQRLTVLYSQLSSEAARDGAMLWSMSPKHHLFLHLCEHQAIHYGNPKFYYVYADEDLVGHMIEVAHSCHPRTVPAVCLYKWLLFMLDP